MGRFNESKVPKFGAQPHAIKRPRIAAQPGTPFHKLKIELRFSFFDETHNWSASGKPCQCDALKLLGTLRALESRVWGDVLANKKRDHPIPLHKLGKSAKQRLEVLRMDDLDELWSFHLDQLGRFWGARIDHELRLLWLDPDHQVYPVDYQERDKSSAG